MSEQSQRFVHYSRLEKDYQSMLRLKGDTVSWTPLSPVDAANGIYPDVYRVTFTIRAPTVKSITTRHILKIDCSHLSYPVATPLVTFETPIIKHPHVFSDGSSRVCLGGFPLEESLADLCVRLVRFFQYDRALINPQSLASKEFYTWYEQNRANLPLDFSPLPVVADPTPASRIRVKAVRQRNG